MSRSRREIRAARLHIPRERRGNPPSFRAGRPARRDSRDTAPTRAGGREQRRASRIRLHPAGPSPHQPFPAKGARAGDPAEDRERGVKCSRPPATPPADSGRWRWRRVGPGHRDARPRFFPAVEGHRRSGHSKPGPQRKTRAQSDYREKSPRPARRARPRPEARARRHVSPRPSASPALPAGRSPPRARRDSGREKNPRAKTPPGRAPEAAGPPAMRKQTPPRGCAGSRRPLPRRSPPPPSEAARNSSSSRASPDRHREKGPSAPAMPVVSDRGKQRPESSTGPRASAISTEPRSDAGRRSGTPGKPGPPRHTAQRRGRRFGFGRAAPLLQTAFPKRKSARAERSPSPWRKRPVRTEPARARGGHPDGPAERRKPAPPPTARLRRSSRPPLPHAPDAGRTAAP